MERAAAELRRMRWGVRGVLALGVAASVSANILHARHDPVAQCIAAWPPVALLITVEMVSRIPISGRVPTVVRVVAAVAIAGIAAWVSYWHMAGVVARYGETSSVPYLLPFSVDGLIVAASVSLVELAGRLRDLQAERRFAETTPTAVIQPPADDESTDPVTEPSVGNNVDRPDTQEPAKDFPGAIEPDVDDPSDNQDGFEHEDKRGRDRDGELAADLRDLLPAARTARDELTREGTALTRDALARRLRRNGSAIRNDRVSELLAALRTDAEPANGSRHKAAV